MDRLTARDWTLIVLAAAGGEPMGKVWLQKALFLIGKQFALSPRDGFYDFKPYNYGPFCVDVYRDVERFERLGLAATANEGEHKTFAATDEGFLKAAEISPLSASDHRYIASLVRAVRALEFDTLCKYVYSEYPEMKAKSVFREPRTKQAGPKIYSWIDDLEPGSADDAFMQKLVTACGEHSEDEEAILAALE